MKIHLHRLLLCALAITAYSTLSYASGTLPHSEVKICKGASTTLTATTTGDTYEWTPATGLSGTTTRSVTSTPPTTGSITYTCKVTKKGGSTDTDNLISLGGFEFPPSQMYNNKEAINGMGHKVKYDYLNFDQGGVNINIGATTTARNANQVKSAYFYNTPPHSGDYLFVCDGGNNPNTRVWQAQLSQNGSSTPVLKAGVTYQFSVWAANIDNEYSIHGAESLAKLKFVIKNPDTSGERELSSFTVKSTLGQWNEFKATFTPTRDCDWCDIWLLNYNTLPEGNDFALDDIYFGAEIKTDDDVTTEIFPVNVKDCSTPPTPVIDHTDKVCLNEDLVLTPETQGTSFKWSDGSTDPTLTVRSSTEDVKTYTCEVLMPTTNDGPNLIVNSGFEDVSTSCPYKGFTTDYECYGVNVDFPTSQPGARGWLRVAQEPFAAAGITPHGGSYLLDIDGQDSGNILEFYKTTISGNFKAGDTYKFTYWAATKCTSGQPKIEVFYTINGTRRVLLPEKQMEEGDWKQYGSDVELTIPENCSEITISMVDNTLGWAYNDLALDDFMFYQTKVPQLFIENFEVTFETCQLEPIYHNKITCQNTSVTLTAETEGLSYEWTDGTQILGTERSLTIDATTAGPATYTCNVTTRKEGVPSANLVTNGDFEDVSTECPYPGFKSEYRCYGINEEMPSSGTNRATYNISNTAWGYTPHSGSYCFIADGANDQDGDPIAWGMEQGVFVHANETMRFSFWALRLGSNDPSNNPPQLVVYVAGGGPGTLVQTFEINNTQWQKYTAEFTPTADFWNAKFFIYDRAFESVGNDFALDDITLINATTQAGLIQEEIFNLTVNPIKYGTVTDHVCQGSAYNKDGFSVTKEETEAGGTITKTKNVQSLITHCDSIVTLTLTVDPRLYKDVEDHVCKGRSYNKDGFTATADETEKAEGSLTKTKTVKSLVTGCDSIVTLTLNIDDNPEFSVSTVGRTATVDVTLGAAPFKYLLDGKYTYTTDVMENLAIGDHTILVSDANTCESTGGFSIIPVPVEPMVYFSPNDDGINDVWNVKGLEYYPTAIVQIYDRYHKLLYSAKAADFNGWDGTYNGHPMPMTDYWFVIINEELDKIMSGHFTLKR